MWSFSSQFCDRLFAKPRILDSDHEKTKTDGWKLKTKKTLTIPRKSKDQTLPIGSRESFTWIILKIFLCLVLDSQGIAKRFPLNGIDKPSKNKVSLVCKQVELRITRGITLRTVRAQKCYTLVSRFVGDIFNKNLSLKGIDSK